jgi:type I restriction enzyme S subunit
MTDLPDSWRQVKLGDLGKWVTGSTPPSKDPTNFGADVEFVTPSDISHGGKLGEVERRISFIGASRVRMVMAPSINLVCIGTIGKVSLANRDLTTNQQINSLEVNQDVVVPEFAMWLLASPSMQEKLWGASSSTTVAILNKGNLEKIQTYIPPIDEQHNIVELLEAHLSRLDAALNDVTQAKIQAAQFKVAFLRSAFSGDASWIPIPMKNLGKWGGGGTPSKANEKFWTNGTVPWLSPKDMGPLEITQTVDKITEDACLNSTVKKIAENSVVFVVRSGILERKLPMALTRVETTLNQDMKALTFSDEVHPRFGFYAILGLEQDILRSCRKSGTTVASINTESLMNYEIKIPSLSIQAEILEYVESQLALIDNSVPQVESVLKVGKNLRRSLLQAAFTGQLTKEAVSV